jgi:hypothetical protein
MLLILVEAFIIWKSNRATESRDKRMSKELELRRLRGAQLVRGGGQKREMTSFEDVDSEFSDGEKEIVHLDISETSSMETSNMIQPVLYLTSHSSDVEIETLIVPVALRFWQGADVEA